MIVVGDQDPTDLRQSFRTVTQAGVTSCTYCIDYENHTPIFVAREPIKPIASIWPSVKHYT